MQSMQACGWSLWLLINMKSKIDITFVHNFFIIAIRNGITDLYLYRLSKQFYDELNCSPSN
jgi:hypothetical protein